VIRRSLVLILSSSMLLSCRGGSGVEAPEIRVEGGWARAMPLIQEEGGAPMNSAAYLILENRGRVDDRLIGAKTDVAERVEIHESLLVDEVMRMRRIDGVAVPSGGAVDLRPGGVHLMLQGLTRALIEGEEIGLILYFERLGMVSVSVSVQPAGSG